MPSNRGLTGKERATRERCPIKGLREFCEVRGDQRKTES